VKVTLTILTAAVIAVLVLGLGALMTTVGPWYRNLRKPSWNPPDWVFGPAWTLILGLAAWAGVLAWTNAPNAETQWVIALLYAINIVLHLLWSPLFFNLKRPDWALIEVPFLWLSVLALIIAVYPISPLAAWLLTPYLLWVAFAAFLNLVIVRMNPPFSSASRERLPSEDVRRGAS
jgi:tryptophan-rich sensory protein